MMGIKLKDEVKLKVIKNIMKYHQNIVRSIWRGKWDWALHVARQTKK